MSGDIIFELGSNQRALVTGGGGFLGKNIVRQLRERGVQVRAFSRDAYPDLENLGAESVQGDIANAEAVAKAAEGMDVVFHVAGNPGVWGPYEDFYRTNFLGTLNVIEACRTHGVARLVYTSTPSVVFDGGDAEGIDESAPYPARFKAAYPETKSMAERAVLQANDENLATVALRPHLIWGPGDNHLTPRIIERAKAGALRLVGDGTNKVDTVYVDNAAKAHLLAAERLAPRSNISGKAYFISQGEPIELGTMIRLILEAAGLPPVEKKVSPRLAYAVGAIAEVVYGSLGITREPRLTRFVARELSTAHWFDIGAARRDLGYEPEVSLDEGLERLKASLQEAAR